MSHDVGYEKRDVNIKKIVIPSLIFGLIIVICMVGLDQGFILAKEKVYYEQVLKPDNQELKELRQREADILNNYKMIDKEKGIVQIPIDRAMEMQVKEYGK